MVTWQFPLKADMDTGSKQIDWRLPSVSFPVFDLVTFVFVNREAVMKPGSVTALKPCHLLVIKAGDIQAGIRHFSCQTGILLFFSLSYKWSHLLGWKLFFFQTLNADEQYWHWSMVNYLSSIALTFDPENAAEFPVLKYPPPIRYVSSRLTDSNLNSMFWMLVQSVWTSVWHNLQNQLLVLTPLSKREINKNS